MAVEELTVTVPRKDGVSIQDDPMAVWPLVEAALDVVGATSATRDAARVAIQSSEGCIVLANYLNSEAKRVFKMDYRFKVPLIVLAAEMALDDDLADVIYDPEEGAMYFETDEAQYSFHVFKDWTVDWARIAQEVVPGYEWCGIENQSWAFEKLLSYLGDDYHASGE